MNRFFSAENIHSGLSSLRQDSKWLDMLNFRSQGSSTYVCPPKYLLKKAEGLHTVARGTAEVNYAFGSSESFGFTVTPDGIETFPLWRLTQRFVGEQAGRPAAAQRLFVRGTYSGTERKKIKVSYVGGKLELAAPEPPAVTLPPVEDPADVFVVNGSVLDSYLETGVEGATVTWSQDGINLAVLQTSSDGSYSTELPAGEYDVTIAADGYYAYSTTHTVAEIPVNTFVDYLVFETIFTDLTISVRYSNTEGPVPGGHSCDAAVYKVLANGYFIGYANLNNGATGEDVTVDIEITAEQGAAIAQATGTTVLNLELVCDPTHPEYDHDAGWGDSCHTNLAWVIITDSEDNELYNGAPVGYFVSIDIANP